MGLRYLRKLFKEYKGSVIHNMENTRRKEQLELIGMQRDIDVLRLSQVSKTMRGLEDVRDVVARICDWNHIARTLEQSPGQEATEAETMIPTYLISSLFLQECGRVLTADEGERFVFISGPEVSGVSVLSHRLEFSYTVRTPGGAEGKIEDTHALLLNLERFGHRLLAHFHSHPGKGVEGTLPSGIDERYQERLEAGGHRAIGAIFGRDGFVRFFSKNVPFQIHIFGEEVEQHDATGFRLIHFD